MKKNPITYATGRHCLAWFCFLLLFSGTSALFGQNLSKFEGYGHMNGQLIKDNGAYWFGGYTNAGIGQELREQWVFRLGEAFEAGTLSAIVVERVTPPGGPSETFVRVTNYYLNCTPPLYSGITTISQLCNGTGGSPNHNVLTWISNLGNYSDPNVFPYYDEAASNPPADDYDMLVYKLDASVDQVNHTIVGTGCFEQAGYTTNPDAYHAMSVTGDGDYVVGSTQQCWMGGQSDLAIAKVDANLVTQWLVRIDYDDYDYFTQVLGLEDGRTVVCGGTGWGPSRLYWLNADGTFFQEKHYIVDNGPRIYIDYMLQETGPNKDIFAIGRYRLDGQPSRLVFLRIDEVSGTVITYSSYELPSSHLRPYKMIQKPDGNFLAVGFSEITSGSASDREGFFVELTPGGNLNSFSGSMNLTGLDALWDAAIMNDGSTWFLGSANPYASNPEQDNFYLMQYNASGTFIQAYDYPRDGIDRPKYLFQHWTGGLLADGKDGQGTSGRLALETDVNGQSLLCITRPLDPVVSTLPLVATIVDLSAEEVSPVEWEDLTPVIDSQAATKVPQDCEDCPCDPQ